MSTLVIDIGGNGIKPAIVDESGIKVRFPKLESHREIGPPEMIAFVKTLSGEYDRVVIGYPGVVKDGKIVGDPKNLGKGWVGFNFEEAFGKTVVVLNDALMQAIGSYEGKGRMLFLGLGYGLGTAVIDNGYPLSLECGHLPFKKGSTFEELVGTVALQNLPKKKWVRNVFEAIEALKAGLAADFVVVGGGNVKKIEDLPLICRRGDNDNAFIGGYRHGLTLKKPDGSGFVGGEV